MANADLELDKENTQSLQHAVHLTLANQNAHNSMGPKFFIPQLIPKTANANKPTINEQDEHNREAAACNELLLNRIKMKQSDVIPGSTGLANQLTIPKLRTASGKLVEEPQLNIPLLNQLIRQSTSTEVTQVQVGVSKLKITTDDGGDSAKLTTVEELPQTALIDLSFTVIAVQKNAPPREAASKERHKQAAVVENFDIPFIGCESHRSRPSVGMLFKKRQSSISGDVEASVKRIIEKASAVGSMLDATVGYPRKPQLKYAASQAEMQNLKMCKREDYGTNIKRFRFDTPSPDEIVKEALQKSRRISRT